MTDIEKIRNLMKKLEETDYKLFQDAGITKEIARKEAFETITDALQKILEYPNKVAHQQTSSCLWSITHYYEGQELRDKLSDLDERRKIAHNAAISALKMLNRIMTKLDVDVFDIDFDDRYAIGDWIGKFSSEIFLNQNCLSMDEYMEKTEEKERSDEDIHDVIKQIMDNRGEE